MQGQRANLELLTLTTTDENDISLGKVTMRHRETAHAEVSNVAGVFRRHGV